MSVSETLLGPGPLFGAVMVALIVDGLIGDPPWLYRRLPHPAVLMGRLIGWLDRAWNREQASFAIRRLSGVAALLALLAVVGGLAWALSRATAALPLGWLLEGVIASTLLAWRGLVQHVAAVATGLEHDGLAGGRTAVAQIVGRDPDSLDEAGVCRAAIESLAENYSDGVAAPLFWFLIGGLPGLALYKAINTADSMIGHKSVRHHAFGWAAARLDDLVNLLPARLCGLLLPFAALLMPGPGRGARAAGAWRALWRDARRHRSPNAGWLEAPVAGALGLALAGPRRYGALMVEDGWMGAGGRITATAADIRRAIRLLTVLHGLLTGVVAGLLIGFLAAAR